MSGHPSVPRSVLRGRQVLLRSPQPSDKQDRLACGRHPEAVRMYGGDYRNLTPLTVDQVERWYGQLSGDPLQWAIEVDRQCIGTAQLHHLDQDSRRARYAVGIFNAAYWSRGIGTAVTKLVVHYAFEELHLHRVDLRVLVYNHRAIRCYEKCGFVREGIERDSALVAGEWQSDLMMSILEQEYREAVKTWDERI